MRYITRIQAEIEADSQDEAEAIMFAGSSALEAAGGVITTAVVIDGRLNGAESR